MNYRLLLLSFPLIPFSPLPADPVSPPVAKRIPVEFKAPHGHTRTDPYFWLSEKENPEVIAHLKAERTYADAWMADTADLQETLFQEMKSRIMERDESPPYLESDGYWYYHRFEPGKDYKITCRKKGTLEAPEEIIIDQNILAADHDYFSLGEWTVTPDGNLLAFAIDTGGDRIHNIFFKDLTTGNLLEDTLLTISENIVWAADNKTLFYAEMDPETLRSFRIRSHNLGTKQADDQIVYEEKDTTFDVYVGTTRSEKWIVIGSDSTLTSEARILPADEPTAVPVIFEPRRRGHEYAIDHDGEHFFIHSNDNAKNFRLFRTAENKTAAENWEEVVPSREDVLLEDFEVFTNYLILEERENGLTHIRILEKKALPQKLPLAGYRIPFNDPAYLTYVAYNPRIDRDTLRFSYTSLTTPWSVFDIDLKSHTQKLLKMQEVPGGFSPDTYTSERLFATAADGTKIPISLVYRKDLDRSAPSPSTSPPTVPTGLPATPPFPKAASASSIAGLSTPSPTSAAEKNSVAPGTRTAGSSKRKTPSPISSPAPLTSSKAVTRRLTNSPSTAEAPADSSSVPSSTSDQTFSK